MHTATVSESSTQRQRFHEHFDDREHKSGRLRADAIRVRGREEDKTGLASLLARVTLATCASATREESHSVIPGAVSRSSSRAPARSNVSLLSGACARGDNAIFRYFARAPHSK